MKIPLMKVETLLHVFLQKNWMSLARPSEGDKFHYCIAAEAFHEGNPDKPLAIDKPIR